MHKHSFHTIRSAVLLTGVLFSRLFADAVVDNTFDDNQNDFEWYWNYYDDNYRAGKDDRHQSENPGTASVIHTPYVEIHRYYLGDASDTATIAEYTFSTGTEQTGLTYNNYAMLPFTFGSSWTKSTGDTAQPYLGVSTMLCKNGMSIDITGATSVTFKIRSHQQPLNVRFNVETLDINNLALVPADSLKGDEFGYYGKTVTAQPDTWTAVTVIFSDLALPDTNVRDMPFNMNSVSKLTWEIQKSLNPSVVSDTLDIDEIVIMGYTIPITYPVDYLYPISDTTILPSQGLFSNFETQPYNESPFLTYWRAFTDKNDSGSSAIVAGAWTDSISALYNFYPMYWNQKTGSDGYGQGIKLHYKLGDSTADGNKGYIGISCPLYDSASSIYWNASSAGAKSIYFHYATAINSTDSIIFELNDCNDVTDAADPFREKSLRGKDVTWYKKLPPTNNKWVAVEIYFDSLNIDSSASDYKHILLDLTKIARISLKVSGSKETVGCYAIDNIYFPGALLKTGCLCSGTLRHVTQQKSSFNIRYTNGSIRVRLNSDYSLKSGTVSVINMQGKTVFSTTLTELLTKSEYTVSTAGLTSGQYIVKLDGITSNGKAVNLFSRIHIIN